MKKFTTLSFILFMTFFSPLLNAQCELGMLEWDILDCQDGDFSFVLDFDHVNTSDSFDVGINGMFFDRYAYSDLPVTVGLFDGDCTTNYGLVVRDMLDPNCAEDASLGVICCRCDIFDVTWDIGDCDDNDEFSITIDFEYEHTSDEFRVTGNGMLHGQFRYVDLPIIIDGLDGDCSTEYEFIIRDVEDRDCAADFGIGKICCVDECRIYDLVFDITECNGDSCLIVQIDFEHENTGPLGFSVSDRNGLIDNFQYNQLPLIIDCYPISGDDFEFLRICDLDNPDCCAVAETPTIDCDTTCYIDSLIVESFDCNDNDVFSIELDFKYDNVSDTGFALKVNGELLNTYKYDSLPIRVEDFQGGCDSVLTFVVCDLLDPNCADTMVLEEPCCGDDCEFGTLMFEVSDCDSNEMVFITIDFEHFRTSDSFFLHIGTNIEKHAYTELPLTVGPIEAGCDKSFGVLVEDCKGNCERDGGIAQLCCNDPCEIFNIGFDITDCDTNDMFSVIINFDHIRTTDSFNLSGNGTNYGNFAYADLPITIGPLDGDCTTDYGFLIEDLGGGCAEDFGIGKVCCDEPCEIGGLTIEASKCDTNDMFTVDIDFDYANTSDSFSISGNGTNYGKFAYKDLPITLGPLEGNCDTEYEFVIEDCEEKDCRREGNLGKVCCDEPCEIGKIGFDITDCDSNQMFYVIIDFDYARTSDSFTLTGNGTNYGKFAYADLPIRVGPLEGDCDTEYGFLVKDCEKSCLEDVAIGRVCCIKKCEIGRLEIEASKCDSNKLFSITLDFDYANTSDSFYLNGNGMMYGKIAYTDLPFTLYNLEGDCDTEYEFEVIDCENPGCDNEFFLGKICCEEEPCEIGKIELETTDCDTNKMFNVIVDFDYARTSDSFALSGNGTNYGKFAYTDLPVTIGPLEGDCDTEYFFLVEDCEKDCAEDVRLGIICCDKKPCEIGRLIVEASECDSNKIFSVEIDFDYANTSDSFSLSGNGVSYGKFAYDDLPLTIDSLEGDCDTEYEFVVKDCENPNCGRDADLGKVCCDDEPCEIGEIKFDITDCDSNDMFFIVVEFDYARTSDSFTLSGNGTNYGKFAYVDLPVKIGPLKGDCDTEYELVVEDCEKDCAEDVSIGKVCCEKEECEIGEIKFDITACDSNDMFYIVIDFDFGRTSDSFTLSGNGTNYGKFAYADLPVKIGPLEGDCDTEYELVVEDCEKRDCRNEASVGKVCCEAQACEIIDLRAEAVECNGDSCMVVKLDFNHKGTSGVGFDVWNRNDHIGFFAYDELPLTIECFQFGGEDMELIWVCDNDNPNCCARVEFEPLDCTTGLEELEDDGWNIWNDMNNQRIVFEQDDLSKENLQVNVINMSGQVVAQERIKANGFISTQSFSTGVYVIHITTSKGEFVLKAVKQ